MQIYSIHAGIELNYENSQQLFRSFDRQIDNLILSIEMDDVFGKFAVEPDLRSLFILKRWK